MQMVLREQALQVLVKFVNKEKKEWSKYCQRQREESMKDKDKNALEIIFLNICQFQCT